MFKLEKKRGSWIIEGRDLEKKIREHVRYAVTSNLVTDPWYHRRHTLEVFPFLQGWNEQSGWVLVEFANGDGDIDKLQSWVDHLNREITEL